jgi:lysophospholipase L1-like esterase
VSNAAWQAGLSPYNWYTSASSYILAVNPGAYWKVNFGGTSVGVTVDVSALVSGSVAAKQYPQLSWVIDGGSQSTAQLTSSSTTVSLGSSLSAGSHTLQVWCFSTDAYTARWAAGESSCKITAMVLDTGQALSAATLNAKRMIIFGDSITEGAWILGNTTDLTNYSLYEVGNYSYADQVALDLGVEYGKASFGGQSWMNTFNSDIPPLPNTWNYYFGTNSRLYGVSQFSPLPDYMMVNMGTNDSAVSITTVQSWLQSIRNAAGINCKMFVLVDFRQTQAANIIAGFQAYKKASMDGYAFLINLGSSGVTYSTTVPTYSYDGAHPNAAGHAALAPLIYLAIQGYIAALPSIGVGPTILNGVTMSGVSIR